jgi:hypothetical protein
MISSGYTTYGQKIVIDPVTYTETLTNPGDPNALIAEVLMIHYALDATPGLSAYLLDILLSGQADPDYWTNAWIDYTSDPQDTTYYNIVKSRLQPFYKYIMDLSEYQLS